MISWAEFQQYEQLSGMQSSTTSEEELKKIEKAYREKREEPITRFVISKITAERAAKTLSILNAYYAGLGLTYLKQMVEAKGGKWGKYVKEHANDGMSIGSVRKYMAAYTIFHEYQKFKRTKIGWSTVVNAWHKISAYFEKNPEEGLAWKSLSDE